MSIPASQPPSSRDRLRTLALVAALWTALVAGATGWWLQERLQGYREQSAVNASVRLGAVKDTLGLTLRQLAAIPLNISHRTTVANFLATPRPALADIGDGAVGAGGTEFTDTSLALDQASTAFGLPLVALLDLNGVVVASNNRPLAALSTRLVGTATRFNERDYFIEAMARGNSMQVRFGKASQTLAIYFASRVDLGGRPVGMVLVRQDTEALDRLLSDSEGTLALVTDVNSVVVLSNRADFVLHRLAGGPARSDEFWQSIYQRVPPLLAWSPVRSGDGPPGTAVSTIDDVPHTTVGTMLADAPLKAWVLDRLDERPRLIATARTTGVVLWLLGCVLIWLSWRRLELLGAAVQARRELSEMAQALPLTVFRYHRSADGKARFAFLGRGVDDLFGVDKGQLEADPTWPWRLVDGGQTPPVQPREFMVKRGDDEAWLLADSTAAPQLDGSTTYNGYWLDISSRRKNRARLTAVFEHAPAGYLFFDAKRGITDCNPATLALFGTDDAAHLIGRIPWFPSLSADLQAGGIPSREHALDKMREHTRTRSRVMTREWRFRRLDGTEFDTEVSVIALEWQGTPQFCAIIEDVTARKQVEAAMQRARDAAESASQTKSSFLANMSHELRTPMNAIIGMTHLALEDGLPPRQRDYVEKAHGSAKSLLQILNDILDVSKIEAGQLALERIDFELDAVVDEMADVLGLRADEKCIELLFSAAPDLPRRLVGDPTRLRQVLVNLGGNAIKFTDTGEVTVGMEVLSEDADNVELHGWVRDTGVGLQPGDVERLFQPFTQADASTTRRFGGTGLGLVICRQLVEHMGGRLWVDSEPGVGSTFHFSARFGRSAPRAPGRSLLAGELRGQRALAVDDNPAALKVLTRMLESFGMTVDAVSSGEEALARVDAAPDAYAWFLLDWKMPGMDGVDCARAIIARSPEREPCIVLVTAFGRDDALRAGARVAFAGVLSKPITPSGLLDCLLHAHRPQSGPLRVKRPMRQTPQPADAARKRLAGARILLVEDHPLNRELACELLQRAGLQVEVAEDGQEALRRLADDGPFDGVLMDCQMPVMDGYTATRALRADPRWRDLPVIAMTASALAEDRERALESGMNAHVTKPIHVDVMLRTMAEWIGPKAPPPEPTPAPAPDAAEDGPDGVSLDLAGGLERCMGNRDLQRRLLVGFRDAELDFTQRLSGMLGAADWPAAVRHSHDLKGLAGTIGAARLQAAAEALNRAVAAHHAEPARAELARVDAELARVLDDIGRVLAAP